MRLLHQWRGYFHGLPGRTSMIARILIVLALVGLLETGWRTAMKYWTTTCRPRAAYQKAMAHGLAFSLNQLEKSSTAQTLPGITIAGVVWDRDNNDWIVFGDRDTNAEALPLDAVAVAIRAVHKELEPPGVDIRPPGQHLQESLQKVTYFGRVEATAVGLWFFQFDYWMKRKSLGQSDAGFPGIRSYWHEAIADMESEVAECKTADTGQRRRENRYWLCTDGFEAIEDSGILAFQTAPLRVKTESMLGNGLSGAPLKRSSPDPLATRFADNLTAHLGALGHSLPVWHIENFARLVAGFSWLTGQDPYRDLRHWDDFVTTSVATPDSVSNLTMRVVRSHDVRCGTSVRTHEHQITLSGGVEIQPELLLYQPKDAALKRLRQTILAARPKDNQPFWTFTFQL
jgi:hypothetical protein